MPNALTKLVNRVLRSRLGKYDPATLPHEIGVYGTTRGGVTVNDKTAMGVAAVYAAVYKIATTVATCTVELYQQQNGRREPATDHPAYKLVRYTPNEYQTALVFWETFVAQAVAGGRAYAHIERGPDGYPIALRLVPRWDVDERQYQGQPVYAIRGLGMVSHMDMLVLSNLHGLSPIQLHADNIGLAISATQFGAGYFDNGGQSVGMIASDAPLESEQREQLVKLYREQTADGPGTLMLPFGIRYQRIGITADEAQFIQTRKFQAEEIARIFGVPPNMLGLEGHSTFNNVEQSNIMFGRYTVQPWINRLNAELDAKLLMGWERGEYYHQHNVMELYRADLKTRAEYYAIMLDKGVMHRDEVRQRENHNPIGADAGGQLHTVQVNQITLDQLAAYSEKLSEKTTENGTTTNG